MDWIRENKVLSAILGVILAGVIGLGYLLFDAWGSYTAARDEYMNLGGQIAQIKGLALAPTEQNLKAKQTLVDEYSSNVNKLGGALVFLQPPVAPLKQAEFQAKLKERVLEVKKHAESLRVSLPPEFSFGFNEYLGTLPSTDAVATELSGYLDGVEAIVKLAMGSHVKSIDLLDRAPIPNEKDAPAPRTQQRPQAGRPQGTATRPAAAANAPIAEKRSVSLVMTLDQPALQSFMSQLANPVDMKIKPEADQSHFASLRILRVENQSKEGPIRRNSTASAQEAPAPQPAPAPSPPAVGKDGKPVPPSGPVILAPPPPAPADSVPVIGQELLKVQMEIDLVKFSETAKGTPDSPATRPAGQ